MKKWIFSLISVACAVALAVPGLAASYAGKKVLYIDSYHAGYDWSDGVTRGVESGLADSGVELKVHRMDTKRNKTEDDKKAAAVTARKLIESYKPDVVIASDDNAAKYLVMEYYRDAALPFVFCGVNWDASGYGMPYSNTTGMVEVSSVNELVDLLKNFAKGNKVGFLAEDTLTEHKEAENYVKKFGMQLVESYATDFADWKAKYTEMQGKVDMLIIGNTAGMGDWNTDQAAAHALSVTKIPSGAVQVGPMPYSMIGYLKVAEEQGQWAAESALKILRGIKPADIPVAMNKEGEIMVNVKIAQKLNAELPYELVQAASKVIE